MVYILGWLAIFFAFVISENIHSTRKIVIVFAIFFVGMIAVLRGDVGTDTPVYEFYASLSGASSWSENPIEPLFFLLLKFIKLILSNDVLVIRAVSLVFVAVLILYVFRSTREQSFFLVTFFLPVLFYQYSMNILRFGLAATIFLLVSQKLEEHKKLNLTIGTMIVVSFLFHYSIALAYIFLFMAISQKKRFGWALFVLFSLVLLVYVLIVGGGEYVVQKFDLYRNSEIPSGFSGLSIIATLIIVLAGQIFSKMSAHRNFQIVSISAASICVAYLIALFSYAGLRLLNILTLTIPVLIIYSHGVSGIRMGVWTKLSFVVGGLVGVVFSYKNMLDSVDIGVAPFIPYHVFW